MLITYFSEWGVASVWLYSPFLKHYSPLKPLSTSSLLFIIEYSSKKDVFQAEITHFRAREQKACLLS